ncbi:hypothetical protein U1Q18_005029, partial [Sarracenia purpurea var. burkii]
MDVFMNKLMVQADRHRSSRANPAASSQAQSDAPMRPQEGAQTQAAGVQSKPTGQPQTSSVLPPGTEVQTPASTPIPAASAPAAPVLPPAIQPDATQ